MSARRTLYCSFCGRSQHQAHVLVVGPANVGICDECIGLAAITAQKYRDDLARQRDLGRCVACRPAPVEQGLPS